MDPSGVGFDGFCDVAGGVEGGVEWGGAGGDREVGGPW